MKERIIEVQGIRLSEEREGREVGRATLYVLVNDLHQEPFGLLEDVYVDEAYRGEGIANQLVKAIILRAKTEHCYKLVATSRNDGTRQKVHDWYLRLGFEEYGTEFRMNL